MRICHQCQTELPDDAPEGLCPKCLLGVVLRPDDGTACIPCSNFSSADKTDNGEWSRVPQTSAPQRFVDYQLIKPIASGGMGIVYKARQLRLNRVVALKTLPFGRFTQDTIVKRFRAEAESPAKLRHPNIVAVHDVGEQDGQPYFSMDFMDGPSLDKLINGHPLDTRRAVRFVRTIAEAVQYAHTMDILHRDLKPSN